MTPDERLAHVRLLTRYATDFAAFCREGLGYRDMLPEHDALCAFLQASGSTEKLVLMPRYSFKSCISTVGYSLWRLVRQDSLRILIYSDAAARAEAFLTDIKNHLLAKSARSTFRQVYGAWEVDPKQGVWNQTAIVIKPRSHAQAEPSVDTAGLETSRVGAHYDLILFDDLVTKENVTTPEQMAKVHQCYKAARSLLKPGGEIVMIGTRWHFGDLYGRLLADDDARALRGEPRVFATFIRSAEASPMGEPYPFAPIGLTKAFLDAQRAEQGSYLYSCNPGEAPVLMGDFTSKPIRDVQAGDELVGWTTWDGQQKRRLVKTTVLKVQSRIAPVVKVRLASGRILRCTHDHRWYTGRSPNDPTHPEYARAKVGRKLMYVCDPAVPVLEPVKARTAAWLGGMFDGEGHCKQGSISIAQDRQYNPAVHARIGTALDELEFDYGTCRRGHYWVNGGLDGKRRFAEWCDPVKKDRIIESLYRRGGQFVREKDHVVEITPDGEETVYALVTGTSNYIIWGYASSNCLYLLNPVDDATAAFKAKDFRFYDPAVARTTEWRQTLSISCCVDPAISQATDADQTAITVVGTDPDRHLYALDAVAGHFLPNETLDRVFALHERWGFTVLGIETTAFQKMLAHELERRRWQQRRDGAYTPFRIEEFSGISQRSKEQRILGLQPYHENGRLHLPGASLETLDGIWRALALQLLQFPHAAHDDVVDSLAYHTFLSRPGQAARPVKDLPRTSAAWYEREVWAKSQHELQRRLPRWQRPPAPVLAFS